MTIPIGYILWFFFAKTVQYYNDFFFEKLFWRTYSFNWFRIENEDNFNTVMIFSVLYDEFIAVKWQYIEINKERFLKHESYVKCQIHTSIQFQHKNSYKIWIFYDVTWTCSWSVECLTLVHNCTKSRNYIRIQWKHTADFIEWKLWFESSSFWRTEMEQPSIALDLVKKTQCFQQFECLGTFPYFISLVLRIRTSQIENLGTEFWLQLWLKRFWPFFASSHHLLMSSSEIECLFQMCWEFKITIEMSSFLLTKYKNVVGIFHTSVYEIVFGIHLDAITKNDEEGLYCCFPVSRCLSIGKTNILSI